MNSKTAKILQHVASILQTCVIVALAFQAMSLRADLRKVQTISNLMIMSQGALLKYVAKKDHLNVSIPDMPDDISEMSDAH